MLGNLPIRRIYIIAALIILTIIVISLVGVFTVKRDKTSSNTNNTNRATFDNQSATSATSTNDRTKPPWLASLTSDQQKLFSPSGANASSEEKKAYGDLLTENAKKAQILDIYGRCRPSPLVLLETGDLNIKIRNSDSVSHEVTFGEGQKYTVEPGKITDVKIGDDKKGKGFSYGCDAFERAGFILVTSQ